MRGALLPILLLVAACGHERSREELEDRITELEDENDALQRQLDEAQEKLAERTAEADRPVPPAEPARNTAGHRDERTSAQRARPQRQDRSTMAPRLHMAAHEAEVAAADAVIAAADARQALAKR